METRVCKKCFVEKSTDAFYVKKSGAYAGYIQTFCKDCQSKRAMEYYADRRDQRKAIQRKYYHETLKLDPLHCRRTKLRRWEIKLNLPPGWFVRKHDEQNGLCGICGKAEVTRSTGKYPSEKSLAIDHCHERMVARGLLCMSCNTKLAVLENKEFVDLATAYLAKYQTAPKS